MIIVSKWDKRNNQRKLDNSIYKVLDTINWMNNKKPKIALAVQIQNQEKHWRKERPQTLP